MSDICHREPSHGYEQQPSNRHVAQTCSGSFSLSSSSSQRSANSAYVSSLTYTTRLLSFPRLDKICDHGFAARCLAERRGVAVAVLCLFRVRCPSAVVGAITFSPVDAVYRKVVAVAIGHRPAVEVRKRVLPLFADCDTFPIVSATFTYPFHR